MTSMSETVRDDRPLATEIKFLVAPDLGVQIREWSRRQMSPDPYASGPDGDTYQTTTLYQETDALDVFNRRGSFGRSKYRVRRYGVSDVAFLERKMRTSERLAKRRTIVPLDEIARLCEPGTERHWAGAWFHRRLRARDLHPVCAIQYDRMARVSMSVTGPLRMTIDERLRAWPVNDFTWARPSADEVDVIGEHMVVELKYRISLPALFKQLIETFNLPPGKFSKYRAAMPALGLATVEDETPCASC